jgi:hypothetical protein
MKFEICLTLVFSWGISEVTPNKKGDLAIALEIFKT